MRILLDGNLPRRLVRDLAGHTVTTIQQLGWDRTEDPDMLDAMEGRFDVLLTIDKTIRFQNTISDKSYMVIVFEAALTNRYEDLLPYLPQLALALCAPRAGAFVLLVSPSRLLIALGKSAWRDRRGVKPIRQTSSGYKLE